MHFEIEYPNSVYIYDPYHVEGDTEQTEKNLQQHLSSAERKLYRQLRKSYLFGQEYQKFTGRSYLVRYPREHPTHFMWPADYFGQQHWVTSKETHFQQMPPEQLLTKINTRGKRRQLAPDAPRLLQEYRNKDEEGVLNMTLTVLSCAPRVLEIRNFLSPTEVAHVLDVAATERLSRSLTGNVDRDHDNDDESEGTRKTRTSTNSWVERERSPIIDAIYRRAADLLRIDEALLRSRGDGEYADLGFNGTIAESLQLVHYAPGEEYTAHHDFGFSSGRDKWQSQRFCTLLLYLNEGMVGGATSFPRWANAETFEELRAIPEVGKAVLFYSQLPDGNMDDLSQHQGKFVSSNGRFPCAACI
jgi:prolyl 4-hydroxylase